MQEDVTEAKVGDACPTDALEEYILDSNKCISYLTIEHRGKVDKNLGDNFNNWIYGCDICQQVCPWSKKFAVKSDEESFKPRKSIINSNLHEMDQDMYLKLFKKSAMKRTKFSGLKRNLNLIK